MKAADRFGLSFLPDAAPDVKSALAYFADTFALAEMADHAGLHSIKITEHYLNPYGGYCPAPLTFLAAVAARTRHVRLMTGCLLPTFHHPLRLASETAMVDVISGGRLDVGFARAYLPYEFEAFGVPLDESRERFVTTVETVVKLWKDTGVSLTTPFSSLKNATSLPRPLQKPHPPVWIAAVRTPESFTWAGEKGFGLMITVSVTPMSFLKEMVEIYRKAFRAAHDENKAQPTVILSLPLYIADTDRQAFDEGDRYLRRYFRVWEGAARAWNAANSLAYAGYSGMADAIRQATPEAMHRQGNVVMGCPERVKELILRLQEELAPDCVNWLVDFGAMPGELSRRNLRSFIDKVLPSL